MSDWHHDAACNGADDPEVFFRTDAASINEAKGICSGCEVTTACLSEVLAHEASDYYRAGIWGGTTPDERAGRPVRRSRAFAPSHCIECRRELRPSGAAPDDRPPHGGRGRCERCYNRGRMRQVRAIERTYA